MTPEIILSKTVQELLPINGDDLSFAKKYIVEYLLEIKDYPNDIMYKNILYMNACNKIGKFAMTYRNKLLKSIYSRNRNKLQEIINSCETDEYDNNHYLTGKYLNRKNNELQEEITALIYLFDKYNHVQKLPSKLYNENIERKCKEDICLINNSNTNPIVENENTFVWVPHRDKILNVAHCFKIPELLLYLIENRINPYTRLPFDEDLKESILKKYEYEAILMKIYT